MTRAASALAFVVLSAVHAAAQAPAPAPPIIVTQGEATVKRAPDRAWITVGVETRDVRAAEARRRNAEAMAGAQQALRKAGVGGDAIRTTAFSLTPEFEWDNGRSLLRGYVVRNQIEVRVDDLNRLPDVLDAVGGPRPVALTILGPRFDLRDEASARTEALRLAVQDALSRAEALAAGARRSVGPIVRIQEVSAGGPPPPRPMPLAMRAEAAQDVPTPVTPGEIEVRAEVSVTVEIR